MKGQVPQGILDAILKEAAALASVARDQLVVVRAESVVWNDQSSTVSIPIRVAAVRPNRHGD